MMRTYVITSVLILLLGFTSCKEENKPQATKGPKPFLVQSATKSNITSHIEYAANIEGVQNIEIRPKVDGFVEQIYVDEGSFVNKGQLLFRLSGENLNQQVNAGEAKIELAESQVLLAQVELEKIAPLVEKNIISPIQLKTAESKLNAANAQLSVAKAEYQNAKENLDYTEIRSPVNGIVGSLPYKLGSLVGRSEPKPLTTVSNIENVYAYFTLNEKQLLEFNRDLNGGTLNQKIQELPEVELILSDGSLYQYKGKVETINGMVNPRTGSISYKAIFPNPEKLLRSGISGKVKVPSIANEIILVPQKATFELQGSKFIYLVGAENKIESNKIEVAKSVGSNFIVVNGLKEGDKFVIEGLIQLRDGMQIAPKLETISSQNTSVVTNK